MTIAAIEHRQRRHSGPVVFVVSFAVLFVMTAIWSVASPLLAGPDEPTHVVKAAGVIRGQFVGTCINKPAFGTDGCADNSPFTEVDVPAFYSLLRNGGNIPGTEIKGHGVDCFNKLVDVPASCAQLPTYAQYGNFVRNAWIYNGRYPPLYYAIVGLPTLLGSGAWALYLMRLIAAAFASALLAMAVTSVVLWSRNRLLLIGLVIAVTPMTVYLAGVVNPSGLEIAAALCLWTVGTILVTEHLDNPPLGLVVTGGVAASVFALTRSLSPFWLALTGLILVAPMGWSDLSRVSRHRRVRVAFGCVVGAAAVASVWVLYQHSTVVNVSSNAAQARIPPPGTSELSILATSFGHNAFYIPGMVGVFGGFDTRAPQVTYDIWYALAVAAFAIGLIASSRRARVVLVLFAVGIVVIPVLISSSQARHLGYVWAGRDTLPFAVGLPVLAIGFVRRERIANVVARFSPAVLGLAFLAQFAAFGEALRRYAVGLSGSVFGFLAHSSWQPPVLSIPGSLAVEVVAVAVGYLLVWLLVRRPRREVPIDAMPEREWLSPTDVSDERAVIETVSSPG